MAFGDHEMRRSFWVTKYLASDENPFFVLLEDHSQVSRFEVETDTLLDPLVPGEVDDRRAKLVLTVELRPYYATFLNLSFS
jgi:hypothetical protein